MPMQNIPPVQSNRPKTAWENYMTSAAPAASARNRGLAGVRSNALQSQQRTQPDAPPAMRQALTPGAVEATAGDFRSVTNQYNNWYNQQIRAGVPPDQIQHMPGFAYFQDQIVKMAGQVKDPALIAQNISQAQGRVNDPVFGKSAQAILSAFQNRQTQLNGAGAPPSTATPPTIDDTTLSLVNQFAAPQSAPAAPPPSAYTPQPMPIGIAPRGAFDQFAPDQSVGTALNTDGPPMDLSKAQPMPMPTLRTDEVIYDTPPPQPMPRVSTPSDTVKVPRAPAQPTLPSATDDKLMGLNQGRGVADHNALIGVSKPAPLPPSTPPTGGLSSITSQKPEPKPENAPSFEMDQGTTDYLSRISGNY